MMSISTRVRWLVPAVAMLLAVAPLATGTPPVVHAATSLVVTSTATSGSCSGSGNPGYTLACAVNQASADGAGDTITFNIPTSGPTADRGCTGSPVVCVLHPNGLYLEASNTTINGYSQPGASPNTAALGAGDNAQDVIQLDGLVSGRPSTGDAIDVYGSNNTIEGLSITDYAIGIALGVYSLAGSTGNTVVGNFLGVAPDGKTAAPNQHGVLAELSSETATQVIASNQIGSPAPPDRNLISGNTTDGINLYGGGGNTVQGNYIGTDRTGTAALANGTGLVLNGEGEYGTASGDTIGGTAAGTGNVISGNTQAGISTAYLPGGFLPSLFGVVQGNLIGVNAAGSAPLPNGIGIDLNRVYHFTIGGTTSGAGNVISNSVNQGILEEGPGNKNLIAGNTIASNGGWGIQVGTSSGDVIHTAITRNIFSGNAGGITLFGQPPATCTAGPGPGAPNDWLPCPLIKSATVAGISGEACAGCTVEVYTTPSGADDEGRALLATLTVPSCVSPCSGIRPWTLPAAQYAAALATGQFIAATATRPAAPGSPAETSAFSRAAPIGRPLVVTTVADLTSPCASSSYSLRCAIDQANADGAGDSIGFNIPSGCSSSPAVCTIQPANSLPSLTAPSTAINAYTQPGANANTLVVADPSRANTAGDNAVIAVRLTGAGTSTDGLTIAAAYDDVEGLAIENFGGSGIHLSGTTAAFDIVAGDFLGVDVNGVTAGANGNGALADGGAAQGLVGGRQPGDSNVISGNTTYGVEVNAPGADTVANNLVGTTASTGAALANGYTGIFLYGAPGNTVGGARFGDGNVISGNGVDGIDGLSSSGNTIAGNNIGINGTDSAALPNSADGIYLYLGNNNTIGAAAGGAYAANRIELNGADGVDILSESGDTVAANIIGAFGRGNKGNGVLVGNTTSTSAAQHLRLRLPQISLPAATGGSSIVTATVASNVIRSNNGAGVQVGQTRYDSTVHVAISQNSMGGNTNAGILLSGQGNGPCLPSGPPGPNDYLSCPVIFSAQTTSPATTHVRGYACAGCLVEVFIASNESYHAGYGEGQTYLGTATAESSGNWALDVPVAAGQYVTATATAPVPGAAPATETSQYSQNVPVAVVGARTAHRVQTAQGGTR